MKRRLKTIILSGIVGAVAPACFQVAPEPEEAFFCFIAGTRVDTPGGPRPIDGLKSGDEVWSWDVETASVVVRRIARVLRSEVRTICRVEVGATIIAGVTPSHPFYRPDGGDYAALRDLRSDERLLRLVDGDVGEVKISGLHITEHPEPQVPVFNLEVEGPEHNYFAEGILVHNKSPAQPHDFVFDGDSSDCDDWTSDGWLYSPDCEVADLDSIGPEEDGQGDP